MKYKVLISPIKLFEDLFFVVSYPIVFFVNIIGERYSHLNILESTPSIYNSYVY